MNHPVIQKIVSGWMLVVFFFAITPHQFVHDVINHHHDTVDFFHTDMEVSSHHTHCDFLHVVHAPFTGVYTVHQSGVFFKHVVFVAPAVSFYAAERLFYIDLRGPPFC